MLKPIKNTIMKRIILNILGVFQLLGGIFMGLFISHRYYIQEVPAAAYIMLIIICGIISISGLVYFDVGRQSSKK